LFGLAHDSATALIASVLAGLSWIAVLATLNVSAQVALPSWVRGRGLAVFAIVLFGSMSAGSALWGQVGTKFGLPVAHSSLRQPCSRHCCFFGAGGSRPAQAWIWRRRFTGPRQC
jgi:hypothetical protein